MNMDSGLGSGSPYEYVVAEKLTPALRMKKLTFLALYALWCVAFLLAGAITKLILPLLAFIPISTWILVWLTWRYTQVEYEYSLFSGTLTVCRILGGKKRKQLLSVRIKELSAVLPYEDEYVDRINAYCATETVAALSSPDSPDAYVALWEEDGKRFMLCFEPDEKLLKLLKYYNITAVTLRK